MQGDVTFTLDGKDVTMQCTVRAWKEINSVFGSFSKAFVRLSEFDAMAYVSVVAAGLGKKASEIEGAVFATGMPDLVRPTTDYIALLSNGGRPQTTEDAPKTGEA